MDKKKKNLELLIKFIDKLINEEGNEWFCDELAILVSKKIITEKDTDIKLSAVTVKEYGSINKYIENGLIPLIDYSKINDTNTRLQLERDCIEMGKVRLGNYKDQISYDAFAKYAHFQSETLINYYYSVKSNYDIRSIISLIKEYTNQNYAKRIDWDKFKNVSTIPFNTKLFAFTTQLSIDYEVNNTLDFIGRIRNEQVHRSGDNSLNLSDIKEQFISIIKKDKSERTREDKQLIKEYNFILFKNEENFDKVYFALNFLCKKIQSNINPNNAQPLHTTT